MIDANDIIAASVGYYIDGAVLGISSVSSMMVISLHQPTKSEVRAILKGKAEVAFANVGETGFLVWRFSGKSKPPLFFDTPFHIGKVPTPLRGLPSPDPVHSIKIYLQNSRCELIGTRSITLSTGVSAWLEKTIEAQIASCRNSGWNELQHSREISRFYDENQSMQRLWLELRSSR